jgi:hypothetical protein
LLQIGFQRRLMVSEFHSREICFNAVDASG